MDHMSEPFLRKMSETGSSTLMASSFTRNSRLKVALGGRGGLERRIPVAACRELERGACCKKEKGKSSQLRSHCQTKKAITRRRTIRPHRNTCNASSPFRAVLLCFKGAFGQAIAVPVRMAEGTDA